MQDFSSLKKKNAKNAAESPENKKRNETRDAINASLALEV